MLTRCLSQELQALLMSTPIAILYSFDNPISQLSNLYSCARTFDLFLLSNPDMCKISVSSPLGISCVSVSIRSVSTSAPHLLMKSTENYFPITVETGTSSMILFMISLLIKSLALMLIYDPSR